MENNWLLTAEDLKLIMAKISANRISFAILLVFFRNRRRFPRDEDEIDGNWVQDLSIQLNYKRRLNASALFIGRTSERHRAEIRSLFNFRESTVSDADILKEWLLFRIPELGDDLDQLIDQLELHCRELAIEPPTNDRLDRIARSALREYDELLYANIYSQLSPSTRARLEELLQPNKLSGASPETDEKENAGAAILQLRNNSGSPNLASILDTLAKLELIQNIELMGLFVMLYSLWSKRTP